MNVYSHFHSYIILGTSKSEKDLEAMLNDAPGQLNFTVFLSMMGEKIKGKFINQSQKIYIINQPDLIHTTQLHD